ncbi:MAG: hypothetical protein AB7K09_23950, partial [Planctomycetota bacterium]
GDEHRTSWVVGCVSRVVVVVMQGFPPVGASFGENAFCLADSLPARERLLTATPGAPTMPPTQPDAATR